MSKSKESLASIVKTYLEKTNRPYSANDVFNNLNTKDSKLGKTAVNKALEDLSAKEEIKEKVNGKQRLFFADQNNFTAVDDNELKHLDQQLAQLTHEFNAARDELKRKEAKLSALKNCLSSEQIGRQLTEMNESIIDLENRLQTIDSKAKDFDPKLNQTIRNDRQKLVTEWRKRKRMATNMVDMILEGYPKPKKVLIEEIGLETDEQLKACLPND